MKIVHQYSLTKTVCLGWYQNQLNVKYELHNFSLNQIVTSGKNRVSKAEGPKISVISVNSHSQILPSYQEPGL